MYIKKFPEAFSILLLFFCFMVEPLAASTFGLFTYTDDGTSITITDYPDSAVGEVDIPAKIGGKSVTIIGADAFSYCAGVTKVKIPQGVTTIEREAFFSCDGMTSVVIPFSVSSIADKAFYDCGALTRLDIPSQVTSIGIQTFSYCSGLTAVEIHSSVKEIGSYAFYKCTSLKTVRFLGDAPTMGVNVFLNVAANLALHFYDTRSGFTTPAWLGYPSVADPEPATHGKLALEQPTGTKMSARQNFGNETDGVTGSRKSYTIKNVGRTKLDINRISIVGLNPNDFILTLPDPAVNSLADGDITTFKVDFRPIRVGAVKAKIRIDWNNHRYEINIYGKGESSVLPTSPFSWVTGH